MKGPSSWMFCVSNLLQKNQSGPPQTTRVGWISVLMYDAIEEAYAEVKEELSIASEIE